LGAAHLGGNYDQTFGASTFLAAQPSGYAFENSTGYYYMDATNAAVRTPVGGNFYVQNTSGAAVQAVIGYGTTSNSAVALGQLTNGSLSPTFDFVYCQPAQGATEAVTLGQLWNGTVSPTFANVYCDPAYSPTEAVTLGQFGLDGITQGYWISPLTYGLNFIIQWGQAYIAENGNITGNFPITFPHAALVITGSPTVSLGGTNNSLGIQIDSTSTWGAEFPSTAGGCYFNWTAMGF